MHVLVSMCRSANKNNTIKMIWENYKWRINIPLEQLLWNNKKTIQVVSLRLHCVSMGWEKECTMDFYEEAD